jgi:hypothetical protein
VGIPETGSYVPTGGDWIVVQPGLPTQVTGAVDAIQSILQAILVALNISLAILQVVKAFLVGLLDPLVPLVDELLAEIEGLLQDLRQMGVYLSGDYRLDPPEFREILGGYQAYQRRMIGRLVDRTDPTRPSFTAATGCIAIFTYTSADTSSIRGLVEQVQKMYRFFGQSIPVRSFTVPVSLTANYGVDGASLTSFGQLTKALTSEEVPNAVNLRWRMAPPPKGDGVKFPLLAPKGFLIEVSTVKDGLILVYDAPLADAQPEAAVQRTYGLVQEAGTGLPFRLFGGSYMLGVSGTGLTDPTFKKQKPGDAILDPLGRMYLVKSSADNVPIPVSALVKKDAFFGGKFLLQRTFFVQAGFFDTVSPGQGFAATLAAEDMPYEADFEIDADGKVQPKEDSIKQATTVYVRISAVTEEIAASFPEGKNVGPLEAPLDFWKATLATIQNGLGTGVVSLEGYAFTSGDKSASSSPLTVTFPSITTQQFLDAVTVALAVLVLSRADLPPTLDEDPTSPGATVTTAEDAVSAAEAALTSAQGQLAVVEELGGLYDVQQAEKAVAKAEQGLVEAQLLLTAATEYEAAQPSFQPGKGRLATGLEGVAPFLMPLLLGQGLHNYYERQCVPPEDFRADLLYRCQAVASELYARSGPMGDIEAVIVEAGKVLTSFMWSDADSVWPAITILESLKDSTRTYGIGLNPVSMGVSGEIPTVYRLQQTSLPREPGFLQKPRQDGGTDPFFAMNRGSADYSPTVYNQSAKPLGTDTSSRSIFTAGFCRNAFFKQPGLYEAAATVLNVSGAASTLPAGEGNWTALRLFPQGLKSADAALQEVTTWAQVTKAGISSSTDVILAYIDFLQARILSLQSLVSRVDALLGFYATLDMPLVGAVVVTGNGTDGILQGFINAGNKPSDSLDSYGAGMVILAGGLPSFLAEILQAMLPSAE